jgi:iron-sulfur cluster insertion protein
MILEDNAIDRLRELLQEENTPNTCLRVFVQGGGCSGMQYGFMFDDQRSEDDLELEFRDVRVLVDAISMTYLDGARVRWENTAMGSNFVIDNPHAQSTCGCGSSFTPF